MLQYNSPFAIGIDSWGWVDQGMERTKDPAIGGAVPGRTCAVGEGRTVIPSGDAPDVKAFLERDKALCLGGEM